MRGDDLAGLFASLELHTLRTLLVRHGASDAATDPPDPTVVIAVIARSVGQAQAPKPIVATTRGPGDSGGVDRDLPADRGRPLFPGV